MGWGPIFLLGRFELHSGSWSDWLIDLTKLDYVNEWGCLAMLASRLVGPFGFVEAVPRGGTMFARALGEFATEGPVLIADDVLTTGASMEAQRARREAKGVVVFARGPCPPWVQAIFTVNKRLEDEGKEEKEPWDPSAGGV